MAQIQSDNHKISTDVSPSHTPTLPKLEMHRQDSSGLPPPRVLPTQSTNAAITTKPQTPAVRQVRKRNGKLQNFNSTKILARLNGMSYGLSPTINVHNIFDTVFLRLGGITREITTSEIDHTAADVAITNIKVHPDYDTFATRLIISDHHKSTKKKFSEVAKLLYENSVNGKANPLLKRDVYDYIQEHAEKLDGAIVHARDGLLKWFGLQTIMKSYLLRVNNKIVERVQHMFMRIAVAVHFPHTEDVLKAYELMSQLYYTHATPTMQGAGVPKANWSSCFLMTMADDSIAGIFDTVKQIAEISKRAGGIGISVSSIRCKGAYIAGSNGASQGLVPFLKVIADTAAAVNQGGKRPGAVAIYIEPWHGDIMEVLECKRNRGAAETRCRNLNFAVYLNDLFMRRVKAGERWTLFCPSRCPKLLDTWGPEFEKAYLEYEAQGMGVRSLPARTVWEEIMELQIETGNPYLVNKDACNAKSNQQHLGTIRSSNLCTEIVQYSSPQEIACCNLASISLPACLIPVNTSTDIKILAIGQKDEKDSKDSNDTKIVEKDKRIGQVMKARWTYDFEKLKDVAEFVAKSLDRVIDRTEYPLELTRVSNMKHRPMAIGVQGFHEARLKMRLAYVDDAAGRLQEHIYETIYFGALTSSCRIAQELKAPHDSYSGSPMSKGILQMDMWNIKPKSGNWNWTQLRADIAKFGVRNSLLFGPMPTASTSQILGNTESFEIPKSNLYVRRTQVNEFVVICEQLVLDLLEIDMWTPKMRNALIASQGSVQNIKGIPDEIKELYKLNIEIPQNLKILRAAQCAPYVDQSQSLNVELREPTKEMLTALHFLSWGTGLKTMCYYVHQALVVNDIKFTVDQELLAEAEQDAEETDEENDEESSTDSDKDEKNDDVTATPMNSSRASAPATATAAAPAPFLEDYKKDQKDQKDHKTMPLPQKPIVPVTKFQLSEDMVNQMAKRFAQAQAQLASSGCDSCSG